MPVLRASGRMPPQYRAGGRARQRARVVRALRKADRGQAFVLLRRAWRHALRLRREQAQAASPAAAAPTRRLRALRSVAKAGDPCLLARALRILTRVGPARAARIPRGSRKIPHIQRQFAAAQMAWLLGREKLARDFLRQASLRLRRPATLRKGARMTDLMFLAAALPAAFGAAVAGALAGPAICGMACVWLAANLLLGIVFSGILSRRIRKRLRVGPGDQADPQLLLRLLRLWRAANAALICAFVALGIANPGWATRVAHWFWPAGPWDPYMAASILLVCLWTGVGALLYALLKRWLTAALSHWAHALVLAATFDRPNVALARSTMDLVALFPASFAKSEARESERQLPVAVAGLPSWMQTELGQDPDTPQSINLPLRVLAELCEPAEPPRTWGWRLSQRVLRSIRVPLPPAPQRVPEPSSASDAADPYPLLWDAAEQGDPQAVADACGDALAMLYRMNRMDEFRALAAQVREWAPLPRQPSPMTALVQHARAQPNASPL